MCLRCGAAVALPSFAHSTPAYASSRLLGWAPPACRRDRCGGAATTGITTARLIPRRTRTPPWRTDFGGPTAAGSSSPTDTRSRCCARCLTWRRCPRLRGWSATTCSRQRRWRRRWRRLAARARLRTDSWWPRCSAGTPPTPSTALRTCWAGSAFSANSTVPAPRATTCAWGCACVAPCWLTPVRRLLALLTLGEGWHNNHHRYMASARHGFVQPWELDVTFYVIKRASPSAAASCGAAPSDAPLSACRPPVMESVGLAWNLRAPPPELLAHAYAMKAH